MADKHIDEISGTETTGHEWDGIRELNTPLPRWWLWTFYASIVWAAAYCVFYPAWPLVNSVTQGVLGYSSRAEVAKEIELAKTAQAKFLDQIKSKSLDEITQDRALLQFAIAGGRSAFAVNCSQCHGTGAAGAQGYPNLNDDDWIWGGSLKAIHHTIAHGVRAEENDDTRTSQMPAFGRDEILTAAQISTVAEFVLSLSGKEHDAEKAALGAPLYKENCVACHGETGQGNREVGGPRLNDQISLFGSDKATIVNIITNARQGVMPAWGPRLDDETVKQLAIYVHSLGGGE